MYSWIWRHLPGGTGVRAVTALVLLLAAVALLFLVVFPAFSDGLSLWDPTF